MIGYIYCITDTTNGKQYIGQHHYDKEELDPNYHGSGHIIKKIYNKRPHSLKEEYLKTCFTQTEMDEWEKYFIYINNTLYPNGYNLRDGGCGGITCEESRRKMSEARKGIPKSEEHKKKIGESNKGKIISEETRNKLSKTHKGLLSGEKHPLYGKHPSDETIKKISESNKGRNAWNKGIKHTEEARKKMSEAHKGKPSKFKGKHHSEEARKKMSEAHKGLQSGEKNPMYGKHHSEETKKKLSKLVMQYTLDGNFVKEWISLSDCTKNGFNQSAVCLCCRGIRKSHKGFVWKYKD